MQEYGIIAFFTFLGTVFVGGALVTSLIVSFRSPPNKKKNEPYECGEDVIGSARIQFKVGYYLFALLFLIFVSLIGLPNLKYILQHNTNYVNTKNTLISCLRNRVDRVYCFSLEI